MRPQNSTKYVNLERRRHKRINRPFLSRFRMHAQLEDGEISSKWCVVTLQNLGAGGALVNSDKKIQIGVPVDLKINFVMADQKIECKGNIIRIEETKHINVYRLAILFTEIDEFKKEIIDKTAESIFFRKPDLITA